MLLKLNRENIVLPYVAAVIIYFIVSAPNILLEPRE